MSPEPHAMPSLHQRLSGDAGIARLVASFVHQMDRRPSAASVRAMHGEDLAPIERKLTAFLCEHLRAPERTRHASILPMAHFRFSIGPAERDAWLGCMQAALQECGADDPTACALLQDLFALADRLRSDADDGPF